jgi:hypothetical protein
MFILEVDVNFHCSGPLREASPEEGGGDFWRKAAADPAQTPSSAAAANQPFDRGSSVRESGGRPGAELFRRRRYRKSYHGPLSNGRDACRKTFLAGRQV